MRFLPGFSAAKTSRSSKEKGQRKNPLPFAGDILKA
jgi:hypothetical protein